MGKKTQKSNEATANHLSQNRCTTIHVNIHILQNFKIKLKTITFLIYFISKTSLFNDLHKGADRSLWSGWQNLCQWVPTSICWLRGHPTWRVLQGSTQVLSERWEHHRYNMPYFNNVSVQFSFLPLSLRSVTTGWLCGPEASFLVSVSKRIKT